MQSDYTTRRVPIAINGINKDLEPASMKGFFTPHMKNMVLEAGKLRKFLGYSGFGHNNDLKTIGSSDEGMGLCAFVDGGSGRQRLLAFTDKHAFQHTGTDGWINVSPGKMLEEMAESPGWTDDHANFTITHTAAGDSPRGFYLNIVSGYNGSDALKMCHVNISSVDISSQAYICGWIYVSASTVMDDGNITLVVSEAADGAKSGDYVEITIPTPTEAGKWQFFCVAADLSALDAVASLGIWNDNNITWASGEVVKIDEIRAVNVFTPVISQYDRWRYTVATDELMFAGANGRAIVICNNNDDVHYYLGDPLGDEDEGLTVLPHNFPTFQYCKDIVEFWNHLFFVGYTQTGSPGFMSLAHAAGGDIDDWDSSTAGFYTLTDTDGKILRVIKHRYNLIIFSEYSVTVCYYVGSIALFSFPCAVQHIGALNPDTITSDGIFAYFASKDGRLYRFSETSDLQEIGKAISKNMFDSGNTKFPYYSITGYDAKNRKVMFAFVTGSDTRPKNIYALNLQQPSQPWEYFEFAHDIREIVNFGYSFSFDYMHTLFISSDCKVFEIDETSGKMDTTNIACEYQTEDLSVDDEYSYARWQWLIFTARKSIATTSTVTVEYSTDNGATWTAFDDSPVTLTTTWQTFLMPLDEVSRVMRFRFTQDSAGDVQIKDDMYCSVGIEPMRD